MLNEIAKRKEASKGRNLYQGSGREMASAKLRQNDIGSARVNFELWRTFVATDTCTRARFWISFARNFAGSARRGPRARALVYNVRAFWLRPFCGALSLRNIFEFPLRRTFVGRIENSEKFQGTRTIRSMYLHRKRQKNLHSTIFWRFHDENTSAQSFWRLGDLLVGNIMVFIQFH